MICLRLDFLFISYQFTIVSLYFIALYSSCISMDRWCQIFYPYRSIIPNSEVTGTSQNFFPRNQMKFQLRVKRMTNRRSSHPARSTKLRWYATFLEGVHRWKSFRNSIGSIIHRRAHFSSRKRVYACAALGKLRESTSKEWNLGRKKNSLLERGRETKNKNIEKKKLRIKKDRYLEEIKMKAHGRWKKSLFGRN